MGLWRKRTASEQQSPQPRAPTAPGDPNMPGIAGYQGAARLDKNGMPVNRFRYVRPDGKPDPPPRRR